MAHGDQGTNSSIIANSMLIVSWPGHYTNVINLAIIVWPVLSIVPLNFAS